MRQLLATLIEVRRLAMPYFYSEDRWAGRILVTAVVALELGIVYLNVQFNYWNARFYDAIEARDWETFRYELLIFSGLAALFIIAAVYQLYLQQWLRIRWRQWMTGRYLARWLDDSTHYRMRLTGDVADNPDQRIAEDLELFALRTIELSTGLLGAVATLVSFVVILWDLSGAAAVPLFGLEVTIPGYLVWIAILYALAGTLITHLIGRPLIRLNFNQQRFEADFRYHLVRIRENGEQVALLGGENAEREQLGGRFATLVANFRRIMTAQKRLTWFTSGYQQISIIFPFIVVSPAYFAGTITLGVLTQTASAFEQVNTSFSFFIRAYTVLAEWRAVIQRLTGFEHSAAAAEEMRAASRIEVATAGEAALAFDDLILRLPNGEDIVRADDVTVASGEKVLLKGRSGSGKSTLFRAIAGIWPFGEGRVARGAGKLLVLPQRPYLPFGRLNEALAYPRTAAEFGAPRLAEVLRAVGLGALVERLDEEAAWPHVLSQGEQQRLSLARALLAKPDILLLDEATSALDEPGEAALYKLLAERLPGATVVSIGHRATLNAFHTSKLELDPQEDASYMLRTASAAG